jgi:hypothetical protein
MDGFSNALWVATAAALPFAVIAFVRAPKRSEAPIGGEAETA